MLPAEEEAERAEGPLRRTGAELVPTPLVPVRLMVEPVRVEEPESTIEPEALRMTVPVVLV